MQNLRRVARDGFSLIEVAVATAIIGIGVTALLVAVESGSKTNNAGRQLTHAVFLAQEIREWTLKLPFSDPDPDDQGNPPGPDGNDPQVFVDDLDDLISVTYSPPRDGRGNPIYDMAGWSQEITLTWRSPSDLSTILTPGSSDVVNVRVAVSYKGQEMLTSNWLATRKE